MRWFKKENIKIRADFYKSDDSPIPFYSATSIIDDYIIERICNKYDRDNKMVSFAYFTLTLTCYNEDIDVLGNTIYRSPKDIERLESIHKQIAFVLLRYSPRIVEITEDYYQSLKEH